MPIGPVLLPVPLVWRVSACPATLALFAATATSMATGHRPAHRAPVRRSAYLRSVTDTLTTGNTCTGKVEDHATWSTTLSLEQTTGVCAAGYSGTPQRTCGADGVFGAIVNPCKRTQAALYDHLRSPLAPEILCPQRTENQATWLETAAGSSNVAGTCNLGWAGSPSRSCDLTGNWGLVTGSCTRTAFCMSY